MILTSVLQAMGLFAATNIDDIVVLSLFFARGAGQRGTTARILAGQYLGFAGILGAAVLVTIRCRSIPALGSHPVLRSHPSGPRPLGRMAGLARRR